uniref:Uncharacterized protein n=1 Tax=Noccaea caerulescens TaxID=107243 RepID=A0A1J3E9D8_NOCCA
MMTKKKQSRSQSSIKKNLEPSPDPSPSPSPRLLAMFRSKLASGKDLKHMLIRGMRSKTIPGLSSQSRIVRCPKCQKLLQEPLDATSYKCGGCDSILQAKRLEPEGNDKTIPLALLSSESAETGSKTPVRNTHRDYNPRASPSVERETVYKHETSDIRREWMRKADNFSDSDVFDSARSSPYNSRSNASEWTQHEERYEEPPRVPLYPASPSPSSAYEYGYSNSPFHESQDSASEQSYYHHHQPNQFKQYGREGWFQESSVASTVRFQGETSDRKYHHWPSQSQLNDLQYHNLYKSATPHRSVYSERSYQEAAAPHRSTYSERSLGISKSEASSEKSSLRNKKKYVRERNPVVKRYVLPSAGGAPFVTCSYCLELLELPQVSLHGKHKRYQVRCGSCSGVLKFPIGEKADTVLDSPGFLADETIHQDSEGHEEIYPDDSHLDNGSGDRICKSNNDVILSRSLETLQPQLKPSVNNWLREQQPASSETIGETSKIHLEQSEEAHSEKSTEMDNNIFERVGCDLEESVYEKSEILKPEEMFGDGSGESLEVLEKSLYTSDSICDSSSSSNGETSEDTSVKEDTEHISSTSSATPQSPLKYMVSDPDQSGEAIVTISRIHEEKSKNEYENSSEGKKLDKSISDKVRHELEEESRYETSETLEPGKVGEDGTVVSLGKANETLKPIIEGETGEERSVSHQMDPQYDIEIVANYSGTLEPVYLEGSGYAGERTWEETIGDRAGLHLEEYERNYENDSKPLEWTSERAPTFRLHEYELGVMLEPDEDADRRSESSSRDSFNNNEISEVRAVLHEEEPQLVNDNGTDAFQVGETVENGSRKLEETFEWTSGRSAHSTSGSFNEHGSSKERAMNHEEELQLVNNYETKALKVRVISEDGDSLHSEKVNNERVELDDRFRHSPDDTLEQESMMFHFEMSQDKKGDSRQTFKRSEAEEAYGSTSKMAEVDSEAEEEILEDHFQKKKEKIGITSEPSEMVGLRHALYQTQSSPLRSPLTSPIHTPIGSPLHYLMGSPMHSHIVSPLRSPINSSGSLSDVLFFGKRG